MLDGGVPSSLYLKIRCILNVLPRITTTTYRLDLHSFSVRSTSFPLLIALDIHTACSIRNTPAADYLSLPTWSGIAGIRSQTRFLCKLIDEPSQLSVLVLFRSAGETFLCVPDILKGGLMHITIEDHIHVILMNM